MSPLKDAAAKFNLQKIGGQLSWWTDDRHNQVVTDSSKMEAIGLLFDWLADGLAA